MKQERKETTTTKKRKNPLQKNRKNTPATHTHTQILIRNYYLSRNTRAVNVVLVSWCQYRQTYVEKCNRIFFRGPLLAKTFVMLKMWRCSSCHYLGSLDLILPTVCHTCSGTRKMFNVIQLFLTKKPIFHHFPGIF